VTRWLGSSLCVLAVTSPALAQRDGRSDKLPISVSVPIVVGWSDKIDGMGSGLSGLTLATPVSAAVSVGVTLREWNISLGPQPCTAVGRSCVVEEQTSARAALADIDVYPWHKPLVFMRGAIGVSWMREQSAFDDLIYESHSWPLTLLAGVGCDLRLHRHLFTTPLIEALWTARDGATSRTRATWLVFAGLALTLR